jgi:hypothetical protein
MGFNSAFKGLNRPGLLVSRTPGQKKPPLFFICFPAYNTKPLVWLWSRSESCLEGKPNQGEKALAFVILAIKYIRLFNLGKKEIQTPLYQPHVYYLVMNKHYSFWP